MANSLLRKESRYSQDANLHRPLALDKETETAAVVGGITEQPSIDAKHRPAVRLQTLLRMTQKEAALRKRLAEEVALKVAARIPGSLRSFQVTVNDDHHFVLQGSCTSYHAKQVAQHEAMMLVGDSQVVNEIVVHRAR